MSGAPPPPPTVPTLSVLLVMHDFALGGTERIAVRLAGAWARRGARVTIFCGSPGGPLRVLLDPGVEVVAATPPIARGRGSRGRLARALGGWLRDRAFDVAFVPGNFHWPLVPTIAARGIPVVAQVSASLDKPQRGRWRQRAFDWRMRRLLRDVAAVVALSPAARDQVDRILGRRVAEVVPTPALDDAAPPPLPSPAGDALIVAAGRLVPEKGFADLIDAVARLDRPATRLAIVGEGPERPVLEALAARVGVADRVSLPGYAADIRPWLDQARLFVLASRFEGYPAVLVEALAAGRPVVATDCTPATALLDAAGAGLVVPIADPAAMATAIGRMLDAPPPPPDALAALVAQHRIGEVAAAYLALFAAAAR